jgi:hypothetical protein
LDKHCRQLACIQNYAIVELALRNAVRHLDGDGVQKSHQVTAYLSRETRTALEALARTNGVSMSEQLTLLVTTAADGQLPLKATEQKVYDALQHIAIGVDALLKYGPGEQGLAIAKETRQRRLKGSGDAR